MTLIKVQAKMSGLLIEESEYALNLNVGDSPGM
jgi:hypothetical protein